MEYQITKKCPTCGERMEFGYLKSSQLMFWTPEKKNHLFISKYRDIMMLGSRFKAARLEAYNCLKCGLIVCNYANQ